MFTVSDMMTRHVTTVGVNAFLKDAANLMVTKEVSGLPVVDHDGRLAGVLTEHDLLDVVLTTEMAGAKVADRMTRELITVREDTPATEVADLFLTHGVRRFPVVADGKVVGIVSRRDLIRYVTRLRRAAGRQRQVLSVS